MRPPNKFYIYVSFLLLNAVERGSVNKNKNAVHFGEIYRRPGLQKAAPIRDDPWYNSAKCTEVRFWDGQKFWQ